MKSISLLCWLWLAASPALAQSADTNSLPAGMDILLHRAGIMVTTARQPVGSVQGSPGNRAMSPSGEKARVAVSVGILSATVSNTTEYAVTISFRTEFQEVPMYHEMPVAYVDYGELEGLIAGINKTLALPPQLPVVWAKYETRGGLLVGTRSTETRELVGWMQSRTAYDGVKLPLEALREFRDLLVTAKRNLDALRPSGH